MVERACGGNECRNSMSPTPGPASDKLGTADTEQALSVREGSGEAASPYVWLMNCDKIPLEVKMFRNKIYSI